MGSLVFINYSCASLSAFLNGAHECNCDCDICRLCRNKHLNLSPEDQARLQALVNGQSTTQGVKSTRDAELDSLLNMDYSIVIYDLPEIKEPEPITWDDNEVITTPIDSLMPLFKSASTSGDGEYIMKDINTSFKENDIYFYFKTKNGVPEPLRLVVHYYADDPVEFDDLQFEIDYFNYEFKPNNIKRIKDGIYFSEQFDEAMDAKSRDLAAALAHCREANVLLHSKKVSHRLYLNEMQLKNFRETFKLYRLMGGKL